MATWDAVSRIALALPESFEDRSRDGRRQWRVKDKGFCWERPLRRGDLEALGAAAPKGAILAARVSELTVKDVLVGGDPEVFFTTPHFNGYPAILVRLGRIKAPVLKELLREAWLACAPKRVAAEYLGRVKRGG
jgi:hypothetical protein